MKKILILLAITAFTLHAEYDNFNGHNPKWEKNHLTYSVSDAILAPIYAAAFAEWQNVTAGYLQFVKVDSGADIEVKMGPNFKVDPTTIAYTSCTFLPTKNYNHANITVVKLVEYPTYNLCAAIHEIGHALGLAHNNKNYSVMQPYLLYANQGVDLTDAIDIALLYNCSYVAPDIHFTVSKFNSRYYYFQVDKRVDWSFMGFPDDGSYTNIDQVIVRVKPKNRTMPIQVTYMNWNYTFYIEKIKYKAASRISLKSR